MNAPLQTSAMLDLIREDLARLTQRFEDHLVDHEVEPPLATGEALDLALVGAIFQSFGSSDFVAADVMELSRTAAGELIAQYLRSFVLAGAKRPCAVLGARLRAISAGGLVRGYVVNVTGRSSRGTRWQILQDF